MCGIIGYVGWREAVPVLLAGLQKLEYRGYDSAGLAVVDGGRLVVRKAAGRIESLVSLLQAHPAKGTTGIGHTRWATHGPPTAVNAHPHPDCSGRMAIVHNGIIENYLLLKERLSAEGHRFVSQTDTEVIAHLLESYYDGQLVEALRRCASELQGAFALAAVSADEPGLLVAARKHSPLVVASTEREGFIASDIQALLEHTKEVDILDDGEVATIEAGNTVRFDPSGRRLEGRPYHVPWDPETVEKGGFPHFMLKEIHEQPAALRRVMEGRISPRGSKVVFEELEPHRQLLKKIDRIIFTACGTAFYASLVGRYLVENLARLPAETDLASEWRYGNRVLRGNSLMIAVTQSGETADTLAALRKAKAEGVTVLSLVNAVGSSAAREADSALYIKAGPEIGVASTKAYTAQVTALTLFAIYLARLTGAMTSSEETELVRQIRLLPSWAESVLGDAEDAAVLARAYCRMEDFIYLGRGVNMATAYEGALKLKEISYIHAEGYAAGEMKHGPIALICPECPSVAVAVEGGSYEKMLSNIEEVRARDGKVIAVASQGDDRIDRHADAVFRIPRCHELLSPALAVIPLQLFAYYVGVARGSDVDKPRNLAKSVTVE